ncbi:MAG: hypothetical protein RR054_03610 [Clostridia bacterium]
MSTQEMENCRDLEMQLLENEFKEVIGTQNISASDILSDIKAYLQDVYIGTFSIDNELLTIDFINGQKFNVNVK